MAESLYQKRMKVRRMSDIERLAQQYSKDVKAMGSQYQTTFSDYQKKVAEQMAPYESAIEKYKVDMSAYESQAAAYQQRLDAYQSAITNFQQNKVIEWVQAPVVSSYSSRAGPRHVIDVPTWFEDYNRSKYQGSGETYAGRSTFELLQGQGLPVKKEGGKFYLGKLAQSPGEFSESAPTAPKAPNKPEIAEFDQSAFEAKSKELGQTYQREVGERKSARLAAVSRSSRRPLLQGS